MSLFKVVLVLTYKYKKTYFIFAESITEARLIAENYYKKKKLGVINAPEIIDVRAKEYPMRKGIIDV